MRGEMNLRAIKVNKIHGTVLKRKRIVEMHNHILLILIIILYFKKILEKYYAKLKKNQ
jgi:hypothetical protein